MRWYEKIPWWGWVILLVAVMLAMALILKVEKVGKSESEKVEKLQYDSTSIVHEIKTEEEHIYHIDDKIKVTVPGGTVIGDSGDLVIEVERKDEIVEKETIEDKKIEVVVIDKDNDRELPGRKNMDSRLRGNDEGSGSDDGDKQDVGKRIRVCAGPVYNLNEGAVGGIAGLAARIWKGIHLAAGIETTDFRRFGVTVGPAIRVANVLGVEVMVMAGYSHRESIIAGVTICR